MISVIVHKFLSIFKYLIDTKSEHCTLLSEKISLQIYYESTHYLLPTPFPDILKEIDIHHLFNIKIPIKFTAQLI